MKFKAILFNIIIGLFILSINLVSDKVIAAPIESSRALLQAMIKEHSEEAPKEAIITTSSTPTSPFFKTHTIVFFYASTCPYCLQEAPILKSWALENGVRIEARSIDDKALPEFQDARPATKDLIDAAYQGQPIRYPALFVLNDLTHVLYPVAIGGLSEAELKIRMETLVPKIIAYEGRAVI